ncbi:hypothetical protein C4D60_Mb06t36610 [Musa balbisiana]|uniref:Uncharacterized protein n=1 Tax=Musa balbisiana TaxID=52838 RepID=A0A4S8IVS1_MUSBA|nr:hypothetical protein C4D60_Mb06t36610 [Musa balbisiana]
MTSIASSIWDGSGSLKLTQSEGSWRKSSKTGSTNGQLLFPSNTNLNNAYTGHDMDSLLALKGTTAEILNQGLEATATFQSDGAPDLWRALSLLSTNKSHSPPITGYANDACPEQPLLQVLPFESRSDGGRQLQESLLFKPFFETGFRIAMLENKQSPISPHIILHLEFPSYAKLLSLASDCIQSTNVLLL